MCSLSKGKTKGNSDVQMSGLTSSASTPLMMIRLPVTDARKKAGNAGTGLRRRNIRKE